MKRVGQGRTREEQLQYHLDDGRAPEFTISQPGRIETARYLVQKILDEIGNDKVIIELGCGAGDISGHFSGANSVIGFDITPAAQEACNRRWPDMDFRLAAVETVEPIECDILVMTEFLEHVDAPVPIVQKWMPLAGWSVIGHPLDEPDPPYEPGHIWSYTREDWKRWFPLGGHRTHEEFRFPMGPWDAMILGHGQRVLNPK